MLDFGFWIEERCLGGDDEVRLEGRRCEWRILAAFEPLHRLAQQLAVKLEADLRDLAGLPRS